MKLLVVLVGLIALSLSSPVSLIPGDNSHYVEGESRYIWMPDGDGLPHLVDLHEPVDESISSGRNGANNAYWLFTRQNPINGQLLINNNVNSVRNSNYNGNRPTKVIVHGWNNNGNSPVNTMIIPAFLAVQNCNVIVVDWRALANSSYNNAAAGVPGVGRSLGLFLIWLFNIAGGNWNQVHLVGFSLGAHVVGNAGRTANGRPIRVTGLDPAGPGWARNNQALNTLAGQYVEVIHTDSGSLGIVIPIGHTDFYPNGGRNPQPGCLTSLCSHGRSFEIFASTVRTNHLVARHCTSLFQAQNNQCLGSTLNMGNSILSKRGNGLYGLRTGALWPF